VKTTTLMRTLTAMATTVLVLGGGSIVSIQISRDHCLKKGRSMKHCTLLLCQNKDHIISQFKMPDVNVVNNMIIQEAAVRLNKTPYGGCVRVRRTSDVGPSSTFI
jgi:hypothetical protein